jgi:hypothetical protein
MTKSDRSTDKYATTFFNIPLEKFIDKKHELVVGTFKDQVQRLLYNGYPRLR